MTKTSRHVWISSQLLSRGNVPELCNLGARHRWVIETGILVEKRHGYQYEHCFSYHWNAMKGYHYLMRLGHLINVLVRNTERLRDLTREYGERALDNPERHRPTMRGFKIANGALAQTIREVTEELDRWKQRYDSVPAQVPVRETLQGEEPQQVRVETRRLVSCFRIAVFRAESALRELLRPHYRRWRQDGRTIIQSMLQTSRDLEVHEGELRVILAPPSAPHRTKALAMLCEELNSLNTSFRGSDLRLRFSVREAETVS